MPSFPVCVTCLGTDSEVDAGGACTSCSSRGSARETRAEGPRPAPRLRAFEPDATRTDAATPAPDRPRPAAVRFPEYADLELIERGGMGVVYKATQVRTGRTVALKTMNVAAGGDERLARRFRTEAEALARLLHPGVVPIFEASERDGVPFLAMEYVPGGSLARRLREGPPPSPREAAELAAGVASALAAAHARGITHRDVKPSNVLITAAGRPKLTDFGLASLADAATRTTLPGSAIGTPAYMAPEQADPKAFGPVGPAADVYGLGATLYELLTGAPPFTGDSGLEILYRVCHEAVTPPRSRTPAVPPDLETICLRCLEKRPEHRYPSAALLANALSRYLRGEPVGGPTLASRAQKFSRRYGQVAAAVLVGATLAGAAGATLLRDRDRAAAAVATQSRELDAGRELRITPADGAPAHTKWIRGDTALRFSDPAHGGDGGFGFRASDLEPEPGLLELVRDTRTGSFELTGEIIMREGGAADGFIGLYLMEPGDDRVRRTRVVGYSEYAWRPVQKGKTRLLLSDLLILNRPGMVHTPRLADDFSEEFTPQGELPKTYRPISIVVRPDRIDAVLGRMTDPDAPDVRFVGTRLDVEEGHRHALARTVFDDHETTRGRTLERMPARGAIGLYAYKAEIAVRNLRLKPIPTP